jgi:hypothetical protein
LEPWMVWAILGGAAIIGFAVVLAVLYFKG